MNPNDLRNKLSPLAYSVTQEKGTERPFTSEFAETWHDGAYHCVVCDAVLFESQNQFNAGCGWPSFFLSFSDTAIRYLNDYSHGMQRTEIRCGNCDAHLGHVFPDGPQPTGERFCVNSASLNFTDDESGTSTKG